MEEKILTKHPAGKHGVNISKKKYELVRTSILHALRKKGQLAYTELAKTVKKDLGKKFKGSVRWYVEVVKLDLEARGAIERTSKMKSQMYRLRK